MWRSFGSSRRPLMRHWQVIIQCWYRLSFPPVSVFSSLYRSSGGGGLPRARRPAADTCAKIDETKDHGFDRDDEHHWRAILACGHRQHVRHDPPLTTRDWVLTE